MKLAQVTNPLAPNLSPGPGRSGAQILGDILVLAINALLVAGVVAFIFWFMMGAIRWIMSSGDKAQIEAARNQILNAVVGLLILFALFAILKILEAFFGLSFLRFDIGRLKIAPK